MGLFLTLAFSAHSVPYCREGKAQTCRTKISPALPLKNRQLKVEMEMGSSHLFVSGVFWSQVGGGGSKEIFLMILTYRCMTAVATRQHDISTGFKAALNTINHQ